MGMMLAGMGINRVSAEPPEKEAAVEVEIELVSQYIWRGYSLGGPGFQASVSGELFGNESHGLELGAWGYSNLNMSTKEIDLSLTYSFFDRKVTITLYNYWYASGKGMNYLDFKNSSTSHSLEAQFSYTQNLNPAKDNNLIFTWATVFYGDDKKLSSDDNYKQAYSSYFEIKYEGDFLSPKYGCEISMGFSSWASPMNYEVEKFSWINAELKVNRSFNLSDDLRLTPSVALTINPAHRDAYISFGLACSF